MGGTQLTYYKNQRAAENAEMVHEFALFRKKYDKLVASITSTSKRASDAEKANKVLENLTIKLEERLRIANKQLQEDVTELQRRLVVDFENKSRGLEKTNEKLEGTIRDSDKVIKTLYTTIKNKTDDLVAMTRKVDSIEQERTTLENKANKIIGKIASAKNRIVSLNASTPYRPGAIERTLMDVLEDLKNV